MSKQSLTSPLTSPLTLPYQPPHASLTPLMLPSPPHTPLTSLPSSDAEQLEQTQTEQERRLVDDITAPGGVRAAPPRESLNTFITRSEHQPSTAC